MWQAFATSAASTRIVLWLSPRARIARPASTNAVALAEERLAGDHLIRDVARLEGLQTGSGEQILGRPAAGGDLVEQPLDVCEAPEPELEIQGLQVVGNRRVGAACMGFEQKPVRARSNLPRDGG